MPTHNGVTCDLYIDNLRAAEHHIVTEDETCSVWIVPEEGKRYRLDINAFGTGAPQHRVKFWADGQFMAGYSLRHPTVLNIDKAVIERIAEGDVVTSPLIFGKLDVAEDDDVDMLETRAEVIGGVGSLRLSIWRCQFDRRLRFKSFRNAPSKLEPTRTIKEELLKGQAVSHCTQFGDIKTTKRKRRWSHKHTYIDPKEKPLAIFVFNYASKALLQAQGYIPRTPSPEVVDNDISDLTRADLMKIATCLEEENADAKRRVKQEPDAQIVRGVEIKPTTHIDLSLGDDKNHVKV